MHLHEQNGGWRCGVSATRNPRRVAVFVEPHKPCGSTFKVNRTLSKNDSVMSTCAEMAQIVGAPVSPGRLRVIQDAISFLGSITLTSGLQPLEEQRVPQADSQAQVLSETSAEGLVRLKTLERVAYETVANSRLLFMRPHSCAPFATYFVIGYVSSKARQQDKPSAQHAVGWLERRNRETQSYGALLLNKAPLYDPMALDDPQFHRGRRLHVTQLRGYVVSRGEPQPLCEPVDFVICAFRHIFT